MPPAANTGVGATASTTAGTSGSVARRAPCPPASVPCAMMTSAPAAWAARASSTSWTWQSNAQPAAFMTGTYGRGSPKESMNTCGSYPRANSTASLVACQVIRPTPQGRVASVLARDNSSRIQSASPYPPPTSPRPPPFETAAARRPPETLPMGAETMGYSRPNFSVSAVLGAIDPFLFASVRSAQAYQRIDLDSWHFLHWRGSNPPHPRNRAASRFRSIPEGGFDDVPVFELAKPQVVPGDLQDSFQGREPDELGGLDGSPAIGRRGPHGFEGDGNRGNLEIGQVHRDLGLATHRKAERLHARQPAVALPHLEGYGPGDLDVGGVEVGVEGHEEGSGTDRDGSPVGIQLRWPIVRLPERIFQASGETLVAAAPDVGQVAPVWGGRGGLVEVDGEAESPQPLPRPAGEPGRVLERRPFERDEGKHVQRAHAGVLAGLRGEVYLGGAGSGEGDGGLEHGVLLAGERQDAPVVVRVGVDVQHADAGDVAHGLRNARDPGGVPAFAEVGDRFEERRAHGEGPSAFPGRGRGVRRRLSGRGG